MFSWLHQNDSSQIGHTSPESGQIISDPTKATSKISLKLDLQNRSVRNSADPDLSLFDTADKELCQGDANWVGNSLNFPVFGHCRQTLYNSRSTTQWPRHHRPQRSLRIHRRRHAYSVPLVFIENSGIACNYSEVTLDTRVLSNLWGQMK